MAVYKEEKTNTWRVIYRYMDWTGERRQSQKRGFKTKREALAWEREQLNKATADLDMTFASFVEQYTADMKTRIKENTWATKDHIIRTKLLPYFGKLKMCNITAQQIITWQNEMLDHTKIAVEREDFERLSALAKKYITTEKKESKLQKALDAANRLIARLKAEIVGLKQELSEYKSVRSKLRTSDLERENAELRGKVQRYEDVIQRNNLWHFFRPHREKVATREDVR